MPFTPLEIEEVRRRLSYDPSTGEFKWLDGPRAGQIAGTVTSMGYRAISLHKYPYFAHHIAWFYMTGRWPRRIDHVDRDPLNNAFKNLREALPWQNNANIAAKRNGKKGVTLHRKTGKYQASIKLGGRSFYLGLYETEDEAHAAYSGAAKILFGEFARAA